jgi:hypothetical protein
MAKRGERLNAPMVEETFAVQKRLRAPRAAAVAGILFAVLLIASYVLVWVSIPENPEARDLDVISHSKTISFALNLLPFAGIAFLWFIAVVRNRLGALEDRFFATVFLGSGLLYIAMIFTSAALAGGTYTGLRARPNLSNHERVRNQDGWRFHVFHFNDPATNLDRSTLDCIPRLRFGRCALVKHWNHSVDSARVSNMGFVDKRRNPL